MILWVMSQRGSRKEYKFSVDFLVTKEVLFPSSPSSMLREGRACRGESQAQRGGHCCKKSLAMWTINKIACL